MTIIVCIIIMNIRPISRRAEARRGGDDDARR